MSIIDPLTKLLDPAAREREAERERLRGPARQTHAAPPKTFECRVCGHLSTESGFCPECLADTMQPSTRSLPDAPPAALEEQPPVDLPVDGTLDLHTVKPIDVAEVLTEYLDACVARGIFEVRVVHGKGTGTLKRTVETCLARSALVASFRTADETAGGWGATLVSLRRDQG